MNIKISVTGAKEIDAVLKGMPLELSHKVLGQAHADASKPLVDRAKLLAPEGANGNLVDSIGSERENIKTANTIGQVNVGPRRGRRYKGQAAHLVEYGTKQRYNRKGAYRGIMSRKPFMKPAFESTKAEIQNRIATSLGKKLNAFMIKTLKK